jgi:hypothetical protein
MRNELVASGVRESALAERLPLVYVDGRQLESDRHVAGAIAPTPTRGASMPRSSRPPAAAIRRSTQIELDDRTADEPTSRRVRDPIPASGRQAHGAH